MIIRHRPRWQRYWTASTADVSAEKWFVNVGGLYQDVVDSDYILRSHHLEFDPVGECDWLTKNIFVEIILQDTMVAYRARTDKIIAEQVNMRRAGADIVAVYVKAFKKYDLQWIQGIDDCSETVV